METPGHLRKIAVVRPAARPDAAAVLDILQRAFAEYDGVLDPPSGVRSETAESLERKIELGEVLVCEAAGTVIGCAFCTPEPTHLYVGRFGVLPEWRESGAGTLLLEAAECRARELGFRCARLNVRLSLEGLRGYYERRGYSAIAFLTHDGYPGPTYVQMEKVLRDEQPEMM